MYWVGLGWTILKDWEGSGTSTGRDCVPCVFRSGFQIKGFLILPCSLWTEIIIHTSSPKRYSGPFTCINATSLKVSVFIVSYYSVFIKILLRHGKSVFPQAYLCLIILHTFTVYKRDYFSPFSKQELI